MPNNKNTYTKKERNSFLTGMVGQNVIFNIISTGLVGYYLQYVIFIPVVAIGWIVAVARVWDAVNDPMMGVIVDRTHTKWGKCRPYLIFTPVIIGVITVLTFVNGNYSQASSIGKVLIVAWAAISYVLWGMTYTAGDVPLWSVTSLMTEDETDRAKLLGLARIFASVGALGVFIVQAAQIVSNSLINKGIEVSKANQYGFIIVAIIFTVVATVLFEIAGLGTREHVAHSEEHRTVKESFKVMWQCKPFRQIFISGILRSPIQILLLVAMPLVTYYYANGNIMNIFSINQI